MSSVALSSVAVARPGVVRPALPALIAAQSHSRGMWRAAKNCQDGPEKVEHTFRPLNKNEPTGSNARSRFSGFSAGRGPGFWDTDPEQLLTRMQSMKKEMLDEHVQFMKEMRSIKKGLSKDPFSAIFGRKIDMFREFEKHDPFWPGFLRPFSNSRGKASRPSHSPRNSEKNTSTDTTAAEFNRGTLRYDPISGRMVPRQYETAEEITKSTAVDSQPESNMDKKLDLNPLIHNGPFPPAPNFASRHFISTPLKPKPIESSPGEETINKDPVAFKENDFATSFLPEVIISKEPKADDLEVQEDSMQVNDDASVRPGIKQDDGLTPDSSAQVNHVKAEEVSGDGPVESSTHSHLANLGSQPDVMQGSISHEIDLQSPTTEGNQSQYEPLNATEIRSRYNHIQESLEPDGLIAPTPVGEPNTERSITDSISRDIKTATAEPVIESEIAYKTFPFSPFRVLTYDTSDCQVTIAAADSFFGTSEANSLSEVFSRLQNPGKFVPYFSQMEKDGYEIVTGGGDILIFRKTASYIPLQNSAIDAQPSTSFDRSSSGESSTSTPSSTIPPESTSRKRESSSSKILSRMLFGGVATAASCYAIGVVSEYFRTGGTDGRGPEGFTPFEADRRHRD